MRTEVHVDVNAALLSFDLTEDFDRRLYIADLQYLRPRLHPDDQPQVDKALAAIVKYAPETPGYTQSLSPAPSGGLFFVHRYYSK